VYRARAIFFRSIEVAAELGDVVLIQTLWAKLSQRFPYFEDEMEATAINYAHRGGQPADEATAVLVVDGIMWRLPLLLP
jgi:hypothetical protein